LYDEAFERRDDPSFAVALRRVPNILRAQLIASQRTLESKISESGYGIKPAPHVVSNAIRRLRFPDDDPSLSKVVMVRDAGYPCELYHLESADPGQVQEALQRKLQLENIWHRLATRNNSLDTIGAIGERIVREAFEASTEFYVAPAWGNVQRVNGVDIPARAAGAIGSVDGNVLLSRLPPAQSSSIIEVKNQREWIYPRDPALWDIIRNGFAVNAVPILFARKIYDSAFVYVLERPRWDRDSDARSIRPRFDARGA
jgi:hypothetical protein